jgi:hypothetical protein
MWKMDKLGCEEFGIQIHLTLKHKGKKRFSVLNNKNQQIYLALKNSKPKII